LKNAWINGGVICVEARKRPVYFLGFNEKYENLKTMLFSEDHNNSGKKSLGA